MNIFLFRFVQICIDPNFMKAYNKIISEVDKRKDVRKMKNEIGTLKRKIMQFFVVLLLITITTLSMVDSNVSQENPPHIHVEKEWIPFIRGVEPGTPPNVKIKSSDNSGILIDTEIFGIYCFNITIEDKKYQRFSIPYEGHTNEIGKPEIPVIRRYLEVPYDINLGVEIIYSDYTTLDGYYAYPVQEPLPDIITDDIPEFIIDKETYSNNEFYPLYNAWAREPIIMRGHRIVQLNLCPVQHNPVSKQLKVYSKMEVWVNYDRPAQIEGIEPRLESEAFESLCKAFILNYKSPDRYLTRRYKFTKNSHADYLIITHPDYYTQVQPLADWKERKGHTTKIVKTSDISPSTADGIKSYIETAYDTWNPPPAYVLLVGDADDVPTHYKTDHPYPYQYGKTATDLYYATVDGDDYFPDIFIGRISVSTPDQAETIIDKILDYERNPTTSASFYSDVSLCAFFQDDDSYSDGYEDRWFVLTSEKIRDCLLENGYNATRIYCTDTTHPDGPTNYNNGDPLPPDLLMPGFAWDGDNMDITAAINEGQFIVNHRDHGSSQNWDYGGPLEGWGDPYYDTSDIMSLTNSNKLPVVFSINCMTGWFDGETDTNYEVNYQCFCEEFLRKQNGGAVAAIGSTRISYSGFNDQLCKGFYDALWNSFDPIFVTGDLYRLGQVLTYGKVYMATKYPDDIIRKTEFEEFHLFGDPEMSIWTQQPLSLSVAHPSTIGSGGSQNFVVKVTDGANPVMNALVCLHNDTDIHTFEYTDVGGNVVFNIAPSNGGNLSITVTKHNYLPYEGIITVTDNGAIITVLPDSGFPGTTFTIEGNMFYNGEQVTITLGGSSLGPPAGAINGSFSYPAIVPSLLTPGLYNITAVGQNSGRAAVAIYRVLESQPQPDPYTYSQWDSTTWYLNSSGGDPVWDNPCIQLFDLSGNAVQSNNLEVGTTYEIRAKIYNDTTTTADNTHVTFKWAKWGISPTFNTLGTDIVTVPAMGNQLASKLWTPSVTGHCCIQIEIFHPNDANMGNNKGQENTDVSEISSSLRIPIEITNPLKDTVLVTLEVIQRSEEGKISEPWAAIIEREYPQTLGPGETQTAILTVNPPKDVRVGEIRTFTITGTIDGKVIGGVEVRVVKIHEEKQFLTGIHSTFNLRYDVVELYVRVTDEDYSNMIYDIEIFLDAQQPAWNDIEVLEAPEGWNFEKIGNGVRFYTETNPLLTCQRTKFTFRVAAKRISWYIEIHVTDQDHQNMGILVSKRWWLYYYPV